MLLLIPGPVSTRPTVREAMAEDIAPWDNDFRPLYVNVRRRVLAIAGGDPDTHAALCLQGCGHFAVEAAVRTFMPPGGRILVPMTGAYAERIVRLADDAGRVAVPLAIDRDLPVPPAVIAGALAADPSISHVGLVYNETGTGVVHDPAPVGAAVRAAGRRLILDAVSAFGALPLDVAAQPELDALVFTSNKCLECLPGLSFTVARIDRLEESRGQAGSWSFDLADVWHNYKRSPGGFRFTPPAQVLKAFSVALDLFDAEGGRPARLARYRANADALYDGMLRIGMVPYLARAAQGPVVMNIHAPADPAWSLQGFVDAVKRRGFVISNFYNTPLPSFRIGCIGAIEPADMVRFVAAADAALIELGVTHRLPGQRAA